MWELDCEESWVPKNWCFWTVVLEKTLESPLDCKEINPGISLEGMMLKLKLQYFGHLMRRVDSLEKTLMLGVIGGRRRMDDRGWDGWMASLTRWTWVWVNSRSWWWTGRPGMLWFMGSQRVGHNWATEVKWTELIHRIFKNTYFQRQKSVKNWVKHRLWSPLSKCRSRLHHSLTFQASWLYSLNLISSYIELKIVSISSSCCED